MRPGELFDDWLEGGIHRDKQVDAHGVHLTVAEVLAAHSRGRIDFGGSELQPSSTHPVELTDHSPGDKYAWWRLDEGSYIVRFNESLKEGAPPMLLVGNERLLSCGCAVAPALCTGGEIRSVLTVPKCGVSIKQNARIALLRPLA
ncbi:MAG: dCTP deaminase [Candidatus Brocadiae bacterium]|nr:dCTP deaminase [Candidatus Brocadiia bacterium]